MSIFQDPELIRKAEESLAEQLKKSVVEDIINKPQHYHANGIDVIGFSELQFDKLELRGFYRINVLKYVTRFHKKGQTQDDLDKAMFYLKKLIELEGRQE